MNTLISFYNSLTRYVVKLDILLPTLARFLFAATLLLYFWSSAKTKVGDGLFGIFIPSSGAYVQIFPRAFEAAGYDSTQLSLFQHLIVLAGTWAEFILPALIVLGLLTRLAALGMIGFVTVQSLTDLYGHGGIAHIETTGAWFDRLPDGLILDQRAFWVFVLLLLVIKGAGPVSLDRLLAPRLASKM